MMFPGTTEYILNSLQVHKQLQEIILRDIARRLVKNPTAVTDSAAWEAEKLQQSGLLFDDIIKELSEITERQAEEIKQAFKDAETTVFDYDEEVIVKAGFDPEEFKKLSPSMQQTWAASLAKTSTEAINLTKTTALTSQASYIEACDLALMQVQSGAFDYNTAIRNACLQAGAKGVNVVYPSGWVDKLDVAVRRSVLTGVSQTAGQLQEMRADEMECDVMELSAHSGARPKHAEWQGKLVSRSGKPGYLSLDDIGYGTVTGFKGANCRHNWFMFFEGISKRKYTDEQLEEMKNETVEYNGQKMPEWQAKEKQRIFERRIKESKRQLVTLDEALKNTKTDGLKVELNTEFNNIAAKLKSREAKLKDFCKQTGLYYDSSRLSVFTQATENKIRNFGKSVSSKTVWANKKAIDKSAKSSIIRKKAFLTEDDPMREVFGSAFDSNKQEIEVMLKSFKTKGVEVVFKDGVMAYQPSPISGKPGQIVIDKKASYSAFKHEERHVLDDESTGWLGFRNFMEKDVAIQFEVNAYDVEISLAKQYDLPNIVERLEGLKEKRRRELLGE